MIPIKHFIESSTMNMRAFLISTTIGTWAAGMVPPHKTVQRPRSQSEEIVLTWIRVNGPVPNKMHMQPAEPQESAFSLEDLARIRERMHRSCLQNCRNDYCPCYNIESSSYHKVWDKDESCLKSLVWGCAVIAYMPIWCVTKCAGKKCEQSCSDCMDIGEHFCRKHIIKLKLK